MDSKTTTLKETIIYGKWPINPDNPEEAIRVSQVLENFGIDWFPKGESIFVRVSDMIKIWDQGKLELSLVFRKTKTGVIFSRDFRITIFKPGRAHIAVFPSNGSYKGIVEMVDGRITNFSGFIDESAMLKYMEEFFGYHE